MRILAIAVIAVFCFLSAGCDVILQPAVQGEWSDFQSDKHKVSNDAKESAEQPASEKPAADK
jgi:hypothetical protein